MDFLRDLRLAEPSSGNPCRMSNINDDDITREPTEGDEDRDVGGSGTQDTGDAPTEADDDLDKGGEGDADSGDEA